MAFLFQAEIREDTKLTDVVANKTVTLKRGSTVNVLSILGDYAFVTAMCNGTEYAGRIEKRLLKRIGPGGPVAGLSAAMVSAPPAGPRRAGGRRAPFGTRRVFPNGETRGLGWMRDGADFRDMTPVTLAPKLRGAGEEADLHARATKPILQRAKLAKGFPTKVDNTQFCSRIEDQAQLGSCTANAAAGMVEYMERRATENQSHVDASRLFLYKVTRNLLGWQGDTGAYLRTTMQALVLFGMAPEESWPYDITTFDDEPDAFLYAYAANYRALRYMKLDAAGTAPKDAAKLIKAALAIGYVAMFGFSVFSSMGFEPEIPYPQPGDSYEGGHAILAVGYDDAKKFADGRKGALRIRNSWGPSWGEGGYGWLPYDYILDGLATDFWTCFKLEWIDSKQFQ